MANVPNPDDRKDPKSGIWVWTAIVVGLLLLWVYIVLSD
jgi:hypothetical protein